MPLLCTTYASFAALSRFMRTSMLENARMDYIRTARAKGVSEPTVILKHMLRNSLIPVITILAGLLPALIGGSVIIETIFSIPGIGQLAFQSVLARDYPVVIAIFAAGSFLTIIGILLSDLALAWVDPRIHFGKRPREWRPTADLLRPRLGGASHATARVWGLRIVLLLALVAVFADFIASEKPLFMQLQSGSYFPLLRSTRSISVCCSGSRKSSEQTSRR